MGTQKQRRSRTGRWFAFALLVVSVLAAGVLFSEGTRQAQDAAARMVRVSAGCRVPVTLRDTGDFFVYVEEGPVPMPNDADCTNAGRPMFNPHVLSPHGSTMLGFAVATPQGIERPVSQVNPNRQYDLGPHSGLLTSRFAGREGETVIVGVVTNSPDVAIAIGENVFDVRSPWRISAGVVLALGLVLAGATFRVAARR